ncbi:MAG: radical SAM protein [Capsulimonadales bacterium]|nr:radical SAM protein [Capsulimonadales bacterium]
MADNIHWFEESTGLCPECLRTVPVRLFADSGRIRMERTCPRHGTSQALLASDANEYLRLRKYVPERALAGLSGACCCGPEEECGDTVTGPPTCVLLLEITSACNLRCPTCYADANGDDNDDGAAHRFLSVEEARRRLEAFFRQQPRLDLLMLSGGEPTIHPQFGEILDLALTYPIDRVIINTNGLRLSDSPYAGRKGEALLTFLGERRQRVEYYFSFASFRPETHIRLYGKDLIREKQSAISRIREAGNFVTLVPTVEAGINDDEIAELYHYALSVDNIGGITYQPVMDNGRYLHGYAAAERLTLTGVLQALETQTDGAVRTTDFVGLPCSHPDCCALTYGLLDADRKRLTPLPRHLDVARYLDLFSDRITFTGILGGAARRVWSDVANLRAGRTLRDLAILFTRGGLADALPLLRDPERMGKRVFRIVVKPFMDAHTYDHRRIAQCCTKIVNEHGEAVSFCEYNVFHRGRLPNRTAGLRTLTMAK